MVHSEVTDQRPEFTDRRKHKRYMAEGKAVIRSSFGTAPADIVNIGRGGFLAFCKAPVSIGDPLEVYFEIQGYPLEIQSKGRVVRKESGVLGMAFDAEPQEMEEILLWLEAGFLAAFL